MSFKSKQVEIKHGEIQRSEIMLTTALMCCVVENGEIKYVSQFYG